MRGPCVECGAFLLCPIVLLINPDHASAASAQMVQHRLGDFEAHAEALQPCRKRPAQVVQPPAGNTGCGVERRLRFRPAAKGRSALAGAPLAGCAEAVLHDSGTAIWHGISNLFAYRFVDTLPGLFPNPWEIIAFVTGWADSLSASNLH